VTVVGFADDGGAVAMDAATKPELTITALSASLSQ
jgi:hypothetical protein